VNGQLESIRQQGSQHQADLLDGVGFGGTSLTGGDV